MNLPLLERISVWRAVAVVPNLPYVFGGACQSFIQRNKKLHLSHRRFFNLGYALAKVMVNVKESLMEDMKMDNPPTRHSTYREPVIPSLDEWNDDCERLL